MDIKGLVLKMSAVSALGLFSMQSNAALVSAELDYGNDCNGYFGTADINGFKGCNVQFEVPYSHPSSRNMILMSMAM